MDQSHKTNSKETPIKQNTRNKHGFHKMNYIDQSTTTVLLTVNNHMLQDNSLLTIFS